MRKQGVIYLGLFLMVFGLYAAQLKKKPPVKNELASSAYEQEPEEFKIAQTRIQLLYDQVSEASVFKNKTVGIRLTPAQAPVRNEFRVTFSGEEVFKEGDFAIHESWTTILDFLAGLIKKEAGLHVEISGFADQDSMREKSASDYGSSALTFSFARAEWLAHYFERKHGISIQKTFVLRGMGAVPQGRKIVLRFYFRDSFSRLNSGDN